MPSQFAASDYLSALQALMPQGRVWPKAPDSVQAQVLAGLAASFARSDEAAMGLIDDVFPPTAVQMLPEWEATLGLPDPCAGPAPTIALRQAQVAARFVGTGGQSVPFFIAFALTLGFIITIQEFTGTVSLANTWQVTVPNSGATFFTADGSYAEDPIDAFTTGANVLQCEFERLKPAHTQLNWNFI